MEYNATLNLPKTDFPMRAGLPAREPVQLTAWEEMRLYDRLMEKNEGKPLYILHDGPPYANGDIHIGTALNKILKDFIVRYKNMSGFKAPYVPGWDMHGLPTESAITKKTRIDRDKMSIPEFRNMCYDFSMNFVNVHREQFKRLGVIGEWDNPYLTVKPEFEAEQIKVFGAMAERGLIYRGLRPVYWCAHDETALAEAEIEYQEDPCTSIYVKFRVTDDLGKFGTDLSKTYFVIWTTTTWTLPGNLAICLNPSLDYVLAEVPSGEIYILAAELAKSALEAAGIDSYTVIKTMKGSEFEFMKSAHPFLPRGSLIIIGDHVTLDAGTGCVHTAPGHGVEDFNVCRNYKEIGVVTPVDAKGFMTADAGKSAGLYYEKANAVIYDELAQKGALLASQKISHTYPHCWRCREPIIYRATEQWFVSVDALKDDAVEAVRAVQWLPEWGEERMVSMIRERSDWCISRQRSWGVPIPIFYCADCGEPFITPETTARVSEIFGKEGSNAWHAKEVAELMPDGCTCAKCGGKSFRKETDIMDVWFDSGSTHAAVLKNRDYLRRPADLYLEGGDQYRGWFQSSLLTSIATSGDAPYKTVLTHGWTVDGEGKKMSKSLGNVVEPLNIVNKFGADILRLWVSSCDFRTDMRISNDMLTQLSDIYLKIRNTARFILGNLSDFDPAADSVSVNELPELDRWALARLNALVTSVTQSYDKFEFHSIYHAIHNFCVVDMSNFYLDIIKDRLYCEETTGILRRSAQTTMFIILDSMARMLSPILAYTSEEIWKHMPHRPEDDAESVLFNPMPIVKPEYSLPSLEKWEKIYKARLDANKVLERARVEKVIGKPLEASVTLACDPDDYVFFAPIAAEMKEILIVSELIVTEGGDGTEGENLPGVRVSVKKAGGEKCVRCWTFTPDVGSDKEHPELCPRCAGVVKGN